VIAVDGSAPQYIKILYDSLSLGRAHQRNLPVI
jgi:hypothetical protein